MVDSIPPAGFRRHGIVFKPKQKRGGHVRMFVGEYRHSIDEKNRIFIPSRLRSELGERFMLTKGFDRCLFVFPMPKWEEFAAKITALPMVKNRRERLYFFSNASECTLDSQGRVTVPPLLCEFAGFVKDITVVGNNDRIELWSGEIWNEEADGQDPAVIADALIEAGL